MLPAPRGQRTGTEQASTRGAGSIDSFAFRRQKTMQPTFRVMVNRADERRIAVPEDIDRLCDDLASRPVFTVDVLGERGYKGPTLDVVGESGRVTVFFMDMERGIKRGSGDEACVRRGLVSFRNDAYPELELDQAEVHQRDIIPVDRALRILRQYLTTGDVVDLVSWPSDDEDEWGDIEAVPDLPSDEIPF